MEHIQALAQSLVDHGVTLAFGVTGGGPSLHLICALEKRGVRYIPVAHEGAAALMAGAACADGKTRAVAIGIKGPGFANFYPGMVSNFYENRPALLACEAYTDAVPAHRMHKRLDHLAAARDIFKADASADDRAEFVEDLMAACMDEPAGPGLIQIAGAPDWSSIPSSPPELERRGSMDQFLERLQAAKKPALILGSMLARRLPNFDWRGVKVPVCTTAAAKGVFDETHDYAAGVVTGEVKELSPEHAVLKEADLIIGIGLRNTEVVKADAYDVPLLSLDVTQGTMYGDFRAGYKPEVDVLRNDLEGPLKAIMGVLEQKSWGADVVAASRAALDAHFGDAFSPPNVFKALQEAYPDATLVLDTGYFCTVGETAWQARDPRGFCGSSCGRYMGTSIPTGIGHALAFDRPVIVVCGDGGFPPYLAELRIAAREKLNILFVFMSDGGFGSIAAGAKAKGLHTKAYEEDNPGWSEAVQALGIPTDTATDLEELKQVLAPISGPAYLGLHFERDEYLRTAQALR